MRFQLEGAARGVDVSDPIPGDAVFRRTAAGEFDIAGQGKADPAGMIAAVVGGVHWSSYANGRRVALVDADQQYEADRPRTWNWAGGHGTDEKWRDLVTRLGA